MRCAVPPYGIRKISFPAKAGTHRLASGMAEKWVPAFRRETDLEQPIEPFRKHLAGVDEVGEAVLAAAAQRSAVMIAARRLGSLRPEC